MRRWCHPISRDLWVAAHPAPSEPRGCCARSHRSWAFFKIPTRNSHLNKIVFASAFKKKMASRALQAIPPVQGPPGSALEARRPHSRSLGWGRRILGFLPAALFKAPAQESAAARARKGLNMALSYPVRRSRLTCFFSV